MSLSCSQCASSRSDCSLFSGSTGGWPRSLRSISTLPRLVLPFLILLGAAGCSHTVPEESSHRSALAPVAPTIEQANSALQTGRIQEAQRLYGQLTAPGYRSGTRGLAFFALGKIALQQGDLPQAVERLDAARHLLRRHQSWALAELLYGETQIRSGQLQSGVDALKSVFPALGSQADRTRAAFLIDRTHRVISAEPTPDLYQQFARTASYPEYDVIFAKYPVRPTTTKTEAATRAPQPTPKKSAPSKIVTRKEWRAQPTAGNAKRNSRWSKITIHHTADQSSMVTLGNGDTSEYLRRLQAYFQDVKRWADLPYHYLIAKNGQVYEGRPLAYQGAHAGGSANRENIGIALIGDFDRVNPSREQLNSLKSLVRQLQSRHKISTARIYPHCDLRATSCPGARLKQTVRTLYGYQVDPEPSTDFCQHSEVLPERMEKDAD